MSGQAARPWAGQGKGLPGDDLCLEDFEPGQVFLLGRREVCREQILSFARQYDPQPFHVDERAARASMLKGLAASGWHTCAMFMRLLSDGLLMRSRCAGLLAIEEIRWLVPVRSGDVLSGRVTCRGSNTAAPKPGLGAVTFYCEALNGRGQRSMSWLAHLAFERGSGSDRADAAPPGQVRSSTVTRKPGDHGLKYFEDVRLGDEIAIGQHRFSSDQIGAFSRDYDPRPAHPAAAADGPPCASGWHVAAVWMQRLVRCYLREAQKLRASGHPVPQLGPSPGVRHMHWRHPVYAGDLLTFRSWAERKIELPGRPGWGLLLGGSEVSNQRGEVVVSFCAQLLLEHRERARGPRLAGP